MDSARETAFIIISGPPQIGKRERISKVRSHITKRYFQRQNQKAIRNGYLEHAGSTYLPKQKSLQRGGGLILPPELAFTVLSANHPMRDETFFKSETERRMQKFFDVHMRIACEDIHQSTFLRSMASWTITDAHFTSSKILNASTWDDVQESGEISPWTLRQRSISIRLLNNALQSESVVHTDAIVASFQCLLAFEILNGDINIYSRLRNLSKSILDQDSKWHEHVRTGFTRAFFFLDQTHRLQIGSEKVCTQSIQDLSDGFHFSFPMNPAIFTLGTPAPYEKHILTYSLVADLYTLLSIAEGSGSSVSQATYNYVATLYDCLHPDATPQTTQVDGVETIHDNSYATIIRQAIFILTSCLLSRTQYQNPFRATSELRSLIRTIDTSSAVFPGLLMWCYAIGARFADADAKTWFLMQLMRMSHPWILGKWEETCESICLVLNALAKIRPLCVEEV